jgi:hypothetical protein
MSADLALLANDPTSLDVFDDPGKQIELACQRANAWLKAGIDVRIETIVETKAQAAALAAFAIQKQLGHDAELAALEVQRRAERGIGLAIRRGQESGEIARPGDIGAEITPGNRGAGGIAGAVRGQHLQRPTDYATAEELSKAAYPLADGVTDDQFDDAIEEAKSERNLSRANVVRKVKGLDGNGAKSAADPKRLEKITTLAGKGWSSPQIAREVGNTEEYVRKLARDNGIEIPADRLIGRTKRIDSGRIARETVMSLDALTSSLRLINYDDLDVAEAQEWATSLTESMRALNRFVKQIKEMAS